MYFAQGIIRLPKYTFYHVTHPLLTLLNIFNLISIRIKNNKKSDNRFTITNSNFEFIYFFLKIL